MSRRLARAALERQSGRSIERLPGRALAGSLRSGRTACVGFLACLGVAACLSAEQTASSRAAAWQQASGRILIVVPDPLAAAGGSVPPGTSRAAAILSAAGLDARPVPSADIEALLGRPAEPGGPALIAAGRRSDPAFLATIDALAPGSIVGPDGGEPARLLSRFGARIVAATWAALAVAAAAAVTALVFDARATVRTAIPAARLLHDLGASDGFLARTLALGTTASTVAGALTASALALALLVRFGTPLPAAAPLLGLPVLAGAIELVCVMALTRHRLRAPA
jgi:hypothetical protein